MRVPYKPVYLPKGPRRYRYIIIHDCCCQPTLANRYKIDTTTFQTNEMRSVLRQELKYFELPYHFVCEKIKEDYETIVARPLQYSCENEYPDIDSIYARYGIHICILGNFNLMATDSRMLQQICYRAISPLMKQYRIQKSRVFLHGSLSREHIDCPGFNFTRNKLLAYIGQYMLGNPL